MAPDNPFDCMMDADDYANMDQVHQTTQFLLFFKKKSTLSEQDIDMKAEIECRIQESYQYTDALKDQLITYDDTKWIKSILSSTCLNSTTHTIHDYLTTIQTHDN